MCSIFQDLRHTSSFRLTEREQNGQLGTDELWDAASPNTLRHLEEAPTLCLPGHASLLSSSWILLVSWKCLVSTPPSSPVSPTATSSERHPPTHRSHGMKLLYHPVPLLHRTCHFMFVCKNLDGCLSLPWVGAILLLAIHYHSSMTMWHHPDPPLTDDPVTADKLSLCVPCCLSIRWDSHGIYVIQLK